MHDEAEGESNQHQHDGAEKRRHKATDVKSGNECAGQQQGDGIDHQEEESQSKNAKREGQEFRRNPRVAFRKPTTRDAISALPNPASSKPGTT